VTNLWQGWLANAVDTNDVNRSDCKSMKIFLVL